MSDQLHQQIRNRLRLKETKELLRIWKKHDRNEWTEAAFDAIGEILQERGVELPAPAEKELQIRIDPEGKWLSGLNLQDLEEFKPALEKDTLLLAAAQKSGDRRKEAEQHLRLGSTFTEMTLLGHAMEHFKQATAIFRELGDRNQETSALTLLGRVYFFLQRKAAIECFEQALQIHRELGNRAGEAAQLSNLGMFFSSLTNDFEKAIDYYSQALLIYREMGHRSEEASALNMLGVAHLSAMHVEQAIQCNEQILAIARQLGDRHKEATAFQNMGASYFRIGQHERAIECLTQARAIFHELGEQDREAANLGNLGAAYFNLRQLEKAIECIQGEVDLFEQIGDPGLEDAQKILDQYEKVASKKWWQLWA